MFLSIVSDRLRQWLHTSPSLLSLSTFGPTLVMLASAVLYLLVFFSLKVILYDNLAIGIRDQGFFQQALYNTINGNILELSITGDEYTHLFTEHFFFFLLGFLPVYALLPQANTLFFLEASAIATSGIALYVFATARLRHRWLACAVGLAWLLHPSVQWSNMGLGWYGFHVENWFAPLFLWGVTAAALKRKRLSMFLFLLSLTVSEQFAIPVAIYGLVMAWRNRSNRRFGGMLFASAVVWFWFATAVMMPLFRQGQPPRQFNALAPLLTLLERPDELTAYVGQWTPVALEYMNSLTAPFGWMPLVGGITFVAAIPALALNFLAPLTLYDIPTRPQSWHVLLVIPLLAIAAVDGLAGILGMARRWGRETLMVRVLLPVVLVGAVVGCYTESPLPFSRTSYLDVGMLYRSDGRGAALRDAVELIPKEASVSAEFFIGSQFLNRRQIYLFPTQWQQADYVVLDFRPRLDLWSDGEKNLAKQLTDRPELELVYNRDYFVVFRRRR